MSKYIKIQLIFSPNDNIYRNLRTGYDSYPPPVGLAILASYVKRFAQKKIKIEIIDGNITSIEKIREILDGDIIGFSDWFTNHSNSIFLAKIAKIKNPKSKIIFGGPNASNLGERILYNHPEVDYVVYGDGEEALLNIVNGSSQVPNLWYRSNNKIKFTFRRNTPIEKTIPFDFEDLYEPDIQKYDTRLSDYKAEIGLTPIPISSIRGCLKALAEGSCSYCSIPRFNKMNILNPALAWQQIRFLNEKYGINYFFETGDNFLNGHYHKKLLEKKPKDLNVKFRIYSDFESLTKNEIDVLIELGVIEIFIGLENVARDIALQANRKLNTERIHDVISYLQKNEIRVFLPFLFGLPGETNSSLKQNFEFAKNLLKEYDNIQRVLFSLAVPLVGTQWFKELQSNKIITDKYLKYTGKDLRKDDLIKYELLILLSLEQFTSVKFRDIYKILKTPINSKTVNRIASFGCLDDKVLEMDKRINNELFKTTTI